MDFYILPNGKGIFFDREIEESGGSFIRFEASDLRKTGTGVHAKVVLKLDDRLLTHNTFNIERDDERVRLTNSAYKILSGNQMLANLFTQGMLKHDMDLFCLHAYPQWIGQQRPTYMVPAGEREAPRFLINPLIIDGGGTILFGPPGMGKSYVAMAMAVSVDAGVNTIFNVDQANVLFVNLERSEESLQRRLLNINKGLGVKEDRPMLTLNARGKTFDDVADSLEETIRAEKVELVILDSISRAGMGDLNDNRPVNKIIDALNNSCNSWIGLAHAPRNDSNHVYGSIHFDAGADIVVKQISDQKERSLGVGLQITKVNDGSKKSPMVLVGFEFDEIGLTHIWKPTVSEFPELLSDIPRSTAELICTYLGDVTSASANDIHQGTNKDRSTISSILNNDPRFESAGYRGKEKLFKLVDSGPTWVTI